MWLKTSRMLLGRGWSSLNTLSNGWEVGVAVTTGGFASVVILFVVVSVGVFLYTPYPKFVE